MQIEDRAWIFFSLSQHFPLSLHYTSLPSSSSDPKVTAILLFSPRSVVSSLLSVPRLSKVFFTTCKVVFSFHKTWSDYANLGHDGACTFRWGMCWQCVSLHVSLICQQVAEHLPGGQHASAGLRYLSCQQHHSRIGAMEGKSMGSQCPAAADNCRHSPWTLYLHIIWLYNKSGSCYCYYYLNLSSTQRLIW